MVAVAVIGSVFQCMHLFLTHVDVVRTLMCCPGLLTQASCVTCICIDHRVVGSCQSDDVCNRGWQCPSRFANVVKISIYGIERNVAACALEQYFKLEHGPYLPKNYLHRFSHVAVELELRCIDWLHGFQQLCSGMHRCCSGCRSLNVIICDGVYVFPNGPFSSAPHHSVNWIKCGQCVLIDTAVAELISNQFEIMILAQGHFVTDLCIVKWSGVQCDIEWALNILERLV